MNKCPRCELNYKKDDEQYCPICTKEMMGKEDTSDFDVCILCGSPNVVDGENLCENCLNKKNREDEMQKREEFEVSIDGYSDLIDTDIPDCDLETINDDMEEYDEQDEFEEE